jgi:hypothetical protein
MSTKDKRTLLFWRMGYDIHEKKKIKRPIAWFGNFVYHMCNYNKMVACTFYRIKGLKHISLGCVLRKWKKARETPVMIRSLKARILELVMRQSPMDVREKENMKH